MRIQIIMPGIVTHSQNELKKWTKMGWFGNFDRMKKSYWNMLLLCNAQEDKYKVQGKEKRQIAFTSFRSKLLDDDNLVAGMKYLRDILVEMRLLYDDSPKYLEASYRQVVDKENPRTEIVISYP